MEHNLNSPSGSEYSPGSDSDNPNPRLHPDPPRPNRWTGPLQKWQSLTAPDRAIATSLDRERDADLSIHLYNTYMLKKRSEALSKDPEDGMRDDFPELGVEKQVFRVRRDWSAWPLRSDVVPRAGLFASDDGEEREGRGKEGQGRTYRMRNRVCPSTELEDCLVASTLKYAKERFLSREEAPFTKHDDDEDEKQAKEEFIEVTEDDYESGDSSIPAHRLGQRRGIETPQPFLEPVVSADDERSRVLLGPSVRGTLGWLDEVLMALHVARSTCKRYEGSSEDSDENEGQKTPKRPVGRPRKFEGLVDRSVGGAEGMRSGKCPVKDITVENSPSREFLAVETPASTPGKRKGGRKKKEYPRLEGESEQDYAIRIARLQKKPLPSFAPRRGKSTEKTAISKLQTGIPTEPLQSSATQSGKSKEAVDFESENDIDKQKQAPPLLSLQSQREKEIPDPELETRKDWKFPPESAQQPAIIIGVPDPTLEVEPDTAKGKRGAKKKVYPLLEGESGIEYWNRIKKMQKKSSGSGRGRPKTKKQTTNSDVETDGDVESDGNGTPRRRSKRKVAKKTLGEEGEEEEESEDEDIERSPSKRGAKNKPHLAKKSNGKLKLRDWSEVLGSAALVGIPEAVLARATQRCSDLFGAGMVMRSIVEAPYSDTHSIVEKIYQPEVIPEFGDATSGESEETGNSSDTSEAPTASASRRRADGRKRKEVKVPRKVLEVNKLNIRCPMPECSSKQKHFKGKEALQKHLINKHAIQKEDLDEYIMPSDDEMDGAVHVDGFMRPVKEFKRFKRVVEEEEIVIKDEPVGSDDEGVSWRMNWRSGSVVEVDRDGVEIYQGGDELPRDPSVEMDEDLEMGEEEENVEDRGEDSKSRSVSVVGAEDQDIGDEEENDSDREEDFRSRSASIVEAESYSE